MRMPERIEKLLEILTKNPILKEALLRGEIQIVWRNGKPYVRTTPKRRETDLWKLTKVAFAAFNMAFRRLRGVVLDDDGKPIPLSAYFTKKVYRKLYYILRDKMGYKKEEYIINPEVIKKVMKRLGYTGSHR